MSERKREIAIRSEYITLGQFLKYVGIVPYGSAEKIYLSENIVMVNGEKECRRGKKLRPGDVVSLGGGAYEIVSS